jgi:hypothetical protein
MIVRQASIHAILAGDPAVLRDWTDQAIAGYRGVMCRSIKTLRNSAEPATSDEVRAAALQYVRKVSGFHRPSRANTEVFEAAVDEIAAASQRMLDSLTTRESAVHSH